MNRSSFFLLRVLAGAGSLLIVAGCASLNPCPPYQGEVLFGGGGPGCAIPGGAGILDKVFQKIKGGLEDEAIKLNKIADGFEGLGIQLKKVPGPDGKTKELLVSFDGDVSFAHNSSRLTGRAQKIADRVSAAMKEYKNTQAKVHGHTDATGSRALNERLSLARAQSVRDRMVAKQGISPARIIEVRGFADRFMIIPTQKSEPRNRRVEIRIVFVN